MFRCNNKDSNKAPNLGSNSDSNQVILGKWNIGHISIVSTQLGKFYV